MRNRAFILGLAVLASAFLLPSCQSPEEADAAATIVAAKATEAKAAKEIAEGKETEAVIPLTASLTPTVPPPIASPIPVRIVTSTLMASTAQSPAAGATQLARWGKGITFKVAYSPDGRFLAVASSIGVFLHDTQTLAETRFIETNKWVESVAFSLDGQILAAGSRNGTVQLWQDRLTSDHPQWQDECDFDGDGHVTVIDLVTLQSFLWESCG